MPGPLLAAALAPAFAAVAAWPGKPLRCPEGPGQPWPAFADVVAGAWAAVQAGQMREATLLLSDALDSVTGDLVRAHECSLGLAAAYRVLALAHVADFGLTGRARVRGLQVGLRFMHLSSNWLTHTFVRSDHETAFIDDSVWPITLQESADEHRWTTMQLASAGGLAGHRATGEGVAHDYRHPGLSVAIVSLCAYPEGHVLPRFAMSNHRLYAQRHGYSYHVRTELLDADRPPAWGKVRLMLDQLEQRTSDWVLWADCDVYFMNMSVTLDSLLFRYGAAKEAQGGALQLDPDFHFLVTEDHAMLNTGIFLARSSSWSSELMRRIWGPEDSVWTHHPWWEQAAMAWDFWAELPKRFRGADHVQWAAEAGEEADAMDGIYPAPVRLAPQGEFNSYHPVTSRLVADTWLPGKFVIAFNGVVSSSSPNVASELYGRPPRRRLLPNDWESGSGPGLGLRSGRSLPDATFVVGARPRLLKLPVPSGNVIRSRLLVANSLGRNSKAASRVCKSLWGKLLQAAKTANLKKAEALFTRFCSEACPVETRTYNVVIDAAAKKGDLPAAERWFDRAVDDGIKPDLRMYTTVINAAAKQGCAGSITDAERWLEKAYMAGIDPSTKAYNAVINAAARGGNLVKAEFWFKAMVDSGCLPNRISFKAVMSACVSRTGKGNLTAAQAWFRKMCDHDFEPDVISYSTLVTAAARMSKMDEAMEWHQRLEDAGLVPDLIHYTTLITAAVKADDVESAEGWYRRIEEQGLVPDKYVYTRLLDLYRRRNDAAGVAEVQRRMEAQSMRSVKGRGVAKWANSDREEEKRLTRDI